MNFFHASKENLPEILQLERTCFGQEQWNLEQIESHLDYGHKVLIESEQQGYVIYAQNNLAIEILRIGVPPEVRKQGIAGELLQFLQNIRQIKSIFLEVKESNFPAIQLYHKCGFKQIGSRKKYYADGGNALLFKWESDQGGLSP